jgi:hypothetical protein
MLKKLNLLILQVLKQFPIKKKKDLNKLINGFLNENL